VSAEFGKLPCDSSLIVQAARRLQRQLRLLLTKLGSQRLQYLLPEASRCSELPPRIWRSNSFQPMTLTMDIKSFVLWNDSFQPHEPPLRGMELDILDNHEFKGSNTSPATCVFSLVTWSYIFVTMSRASTSSHASILCFSSLHGLLVYISGTPPASGSNISLSLA